MKKLTVKASKEYEVHIGNGILKNIGKLFSEKKKSEKVAIISDTNVAPLYLKCVEESLKKVNVDVCSFVLESGEKSKTGENFIKILNFLAQNSLSRKDTVIALGGGVVGDIAGFCAASYMRGIGFVQIPTSLLAMVDSSVGGKCAIDLDSGKNLAGAFYQPDFVLCDVELLKTLKEEFYFDAMAEIIKYAMISDADLADELLKDKPDIEKVITRCITIKAEIVAEDEFEGGKRKLLNFGHTVGHAIEKLSNYEVTHGRAVAVGMYVITNALTKSGKCENGTFEMLVTLLKRYNLSYECPYSPEQIKRISQKDKKAAGDFIDVVEVVKTGESRYRKINFSELKKIVEEGIL